MDKILSLETLKAFVHSAELGSFSAAARHLGKAQSAISTSIANLEIDCGLELFDRSGRSPVLTAEGRTLLPHAHGILLGNREFMATANSMAKGIETHICLSIEQGIPTEPLIDLISQFSEHFRSVVLEVVSPNPSDSANLLRQGKADIGLMTEQEGYPSGLQFRGVGYSKMIPVCSPDHPLVEIERASYRDLRQYRQIVRHKGPAIGPTQQYEKKSAAVWYAEDPNMAVELVCCGFGWAELPMNIVSAKIAAGDLTPLQYAFQQNDLLSGIDLVWTELRSLGTAGQWLRDEILKLPQSAWGQSLIV